MLKTVFISYGHDQKHPEDIELVKRIKADLEQENFKVLMDLDRLKSGDDWQFKLEGDILSSDWVLFFVTPYSARRPDGYCLNELAYALYQKKPIAPIMVHFIEPPLSICRIQYLDFQNLNNEIDYKQKITEIISVIREEKELGFEGGHTILLNNLDPLKFDSIVAKHIYGFIGREWIYEEVDRWLNEDTTSRVLWITAEAGYGKSALATYLSETHPSSIAIHFCQYDAMATRDPKNVLKTFIYELSTQVPEYHEKLLGINIKEKLKESATDIFRELLEEPLQRVKHPGKDLVFIIDALDEAQQENGKNPIVDLISNHFSDLPKWLNIIVTSRPEPELIRTLEKFNPLELKANEKDNLNDLKMFISQMLDQDIESTIVEFLLNKSEGNILYLKRMLEFMNVKKNTLDLEKIGALPHGMKGFYQQYFERKFDNPYVYEKDFLPFVNIMVTSNEGLSPAMIMYILSISERDYKKIRSAFGSLLEINDGVLTFYHKSLFDWLSDYDISGGYSADIYKGNKLLVEKLWELYENGEDSPIKQYENDLLKALYKAKANKKLQIVLQDFNFVGKILNLNEDKTDDISMDSKEIQDIFHDKDLLFIGRGENESSGENAVKAAMESPLIDGMSINNAMGVVVNFSTHPDCPIMEIAEGMDLVEKCLPEESDIRFTTSNNKSYSTHYIKVVIIATG